MDTFQEIVTNILKESWELTKVAIAAFAENGGKLVHFLFWIIAGAMIVPCVLVAGTLYPMWEKWGEKIKT